MNAGQLVPDEVVIGLVEERLQQSDTQNGYILDGFPRTVPQAEALDVVLKKLGRGNLAIVDVSVPRATLIERLSRRLSCPKDGASYHVKFTPPKKLNVCDKCGSELITRADDRAEAIEQRLKEYEAKTAPLVDFYGRSGRLKKVDGVGALEDVLARIVTQI